MADRGDKSEVVAVAVDRNCAGYLHNDYRSVNHGKKESSAVLLKRNKRKCADHDESIALCMALEHVILVNGLECKMATNSSKISYVFDTEDFFYRQGGKRSKISDGRLSCPNQARVERFHRVLLSSLQ